MLEKCKFPDCAKLVCAKEYCNGHYQQYWSGRDLTSLKPRRSPGTKPIIDYEEVPCSVPGLIGPCHNFLGYIDKKTGYGFTNYKRKAIGTHKYIWEEKFGKVPDKLVIDHMCRNRACCNTDHLRVVTCQVNSTENSTGMGARNIVKTHCKRGHPFDEVNTGKAKHGRYCRQCDKEKHKRRCEQKK